ncbi:hypothetical protein OS493_008922 [Desmophyllum pertusum]|uniref:Uncharacterized protein n=1 Tax=Desmophyllum pertusum TaxID=174260 RepID=A0A9W9ZEZ1_9CNID|nr:hypothetical protein OS493_008922 [Desmophyllum pertusum]
MVNKTPQLKRTSRSTLLKTTNRFIKTLKMAMDRRKEYVRRKRRNNKAVSFNSHLLTKSARKMLIVPKNKRPDLKRNPGRKAEVSPKREIQFDEQALTEGRAAWVESGKETYGLKCIPQGTSPKEYPTRNIPQEASQAEIIESLPQNDSLQPTENHTRNPEDLRARPKGDLPSCLKKAKLPEM